jgi:ribA/ribD-fused uncharacterized protein
VLDFSGSPQWSPADLPKPEDFAEFHPFIRGVFSQWHPAPFVVAGRTYSCAEQWMVHGKAALFADVEIADAVLSAPDPAEQKRLGQQVRGFGQAIWDAWRIDIVYRGSFEKFAQNPGAARQLRNTGAAMLVEANPRDWNWGNGLQLDDPANGHPERWRGLNLLGRILTRVRMDLPG